MALSEWCQGVAVCLCDGADAISACLQGVHAYLWACFEPSRGDTLASTLFAQHHPALLHYPGTVLCRRGSSRLEQESDVQLQELQLIQKSAPNMHAESVLPPRLTLVAVLCYPAVRYSHQQLDLEFITQLTEACFTLISRRHVSGHVGARAFFVCGPWWAIFSCNHCLLTSTHGDTCVRQAGRQALQGQEMATGSPSSNTAPVAARQTHCELHGGLSRSQGSGGDVGGGTPSVPTAPPQAAPQAIQSPARDCVCIETGGMRVEQGTEVDDFMRVSVSVCVCIVLIAGCMQKATLKDVTNTINSTGVTRVKLSEDDIQKVINTLIADRR